MVKLELVVVVVMTQLMGRYCDGYGDENNVYGGGYDRGERNSCEGGDNTGGDYYNGGNGYGGGDGGICR